MRAQLFLFGLVFCFSIVHLACGKKAPQKEISLYTSAKDQLPPLANAADAPEYFRQLSLLYPQAELYRVENPKASATTKADKASAGQQSTIIQKTNHPLANIVSYYDSVFAKRGFKQTAHLQQANGALLQYERNYRLEGDDQIPCQSGEQQISCPIGEMFSVDITKLPYAENYLIRIGQSKVDYDKGAAK